MAALLRERQQRPQFSPQLVDRKRIADRQRTFGGSKKRWDFEGEGLLSRAPQGTSAPMRVDSQDKQRERKWETVAWECYSAIPQ